MKSMRFNFGYEVIRRELVMIETPEIQCFEEWAANPTATQPEFYIQEILAPLTPY